MVTTAKTRSDPIPIRVFMYASLLPLQRGRPKTEAATRVLSCRERHTGLVLLYASVPIHRVFVIRHIGAPVPHGQLYQCGTHPFPAIQPFQPVAPSLATL